MKQLFRNGLLVLGVTVHLAGCGGGREDSVVIPKNPDPMPTQPPAAAGVSAPPAQPERNEQD